MTEEPKKTRKKRTITRKADELITFIEEPEVHVWIVERARANHRTISQEVVHRLAVQKRNSEKGSKNLRQGSTGA